jgi:hypothetical protein
MALLSVPLINILILVSAGQEEVVNDLVGAGADVNKKNDKGITPLFVSRALSVVFSRILWPCRHYAASKSRIEVWTFYSDSHSDDPLTFL